jgi:hypothetical protein
MNLKLRYAAMTHPRYKLPALPLSVVDPEAAARAAARWRICEAAERFVPQVFDNLGL